MSGVPNAQASHSGSLPSTSGKRGVCLHVQQRLHRVHTARLDGHGQRSGVVVPWHSDVDACFGGGKQPNKVVASGPRCEAQRGTPLDRFQGLVKCRFGVQQRFDYVDWASTSSREEKRGYAVDVREVRVRLAGQQRPHRRPVLVLGRHEQGCDAVRAEEVRVGTAGQHRRHYVRMACLGSDEQRRAVGQVAAYVEIGLDPHQDPDHVEAVLAAGAEDRGRVLRIGLVHADLALQEEGDDVRVAVLCRDGQRRGALVRGDVRVAFGGEQHWNEIVVALLRGDVHQRPTDVGVALCWVRLRLQQKLHHIAVSILRGDEQRPDAVDALFVRVCTRAQDEVADVDEAERGGEEQRRLQLVRRRVRARFGVEQRGNHPCVPLLRRRHHRWQAVERSVDVATSVRQDLHHFVLPCFSGDVQWSNAGGVLLQLLRHVGKTLQLGRHRSQQHRLQRVASLGQIHVRQVEHPSSGIRFVETTTSAGLPSHVRGALAGSLEKLQGDIDAGKSAATATHVPSCPWPESASGQVRGGPPTQRPVDGPAVLARTQGARACTPR